ncbi:MarR family winged helix-turn-helix transcriptional regulator [Actinomadura parmotrematis]|uniref:MarR family transcriptional regulator n=1 Tax=Actinomadura parmotrematis TaxID=2864039 RepID=A0ABS7G1T7_9ACTN|nr:MarR family transcriptional regulator [Actinomadura parmotrematis]MBW8486180.1 MarR family transcriptional regulator [Actinomadura parmotrematis]
MMTGPGTGPLGDQQPGDAPGAAGPGGSGLADLAAAVERAVATAMLAWNRADQGLEVHVSPVQLRAIETIARQDRINLGGLAAELGVIPSSASRLCDRLEAAGLILREPAQADRREIIVTLSRDGQALCASLSRRRRAVVAAALAELSAPSRARLLDSLTEFARACEQQAVRRTGTAGSRPA